MAKKLLSFNGVSDTSIMFYRCNVTTEDGTYYRGKYCESSIASGGKSLCTLYNACVNATIENPQEIDQFCRTNVTEYATKQVDSVDQGNEQTNK